MSLKFESSQNDSLEAKKMDLDSGMLGKFFGNEKLAPTNIAGFTIILIVLFSIFVSVYLFQYTRQ